MKPKANSEGEMASEGKSRWALVLIDVINDMKFPGGVALAKAAAPAAAKIARLKEAALRTGVPVIYVNDNFGRWQSDFRHQVSYCQRKGSPGAGIVRKLTPVDTDYFVLKPKHSGFYSTTLHPLLVYLGVTRLVLTGFAANLCVQYTANDAYMRDYELYVPADCVASERKADTRQALRHMERFLKADIRPSSKLRFRR